MYFPDPTFSRSRLAATGRVSGVSPETDRRLKQNSVQRDTFNYNYRNYRGSSDACLAVPRSAYDQDAAGRPLGGAGLLAAAPPPAAGLHTPQDLDFPPALCLVLEGNLR